MEWLLKGKPLREKEGNRMRTQRKVRKGKARFPRFVRVVFSFVSFVSYSYSVFVRVVFPFPPLCSACQAGHQSGMGSFTPFVYCLTNTSVDLLTDNFT